VRSVFQLVPVSALDGRQPFAKGSGGLFPTFRKTEKDSIACGILEKGLRTACDMVHSSLCDQAYYTGNVGKSDRHHLFHLHYLHAT